MKELVVWNVRVLLRSASRRSACVLPWPDDIEVQDLSFFDLLYTKYRSLVQIE